MKKLAKIALKLPGVETGTSCNKVSYKIGNRAFMYVGEKERNYNVMLKLDEHLGEAEWLAKQYPDQFHVGKNGWVKIEMDHGEEPTQGVWQRWVGESYQLMAPAKVQVARSTGTNRQTKPSSRKSSKKKKRTGSSAQIQTGTAAKKVTRKKAARKKAVAKKTVAKKAARKKAVRKNTNRK